MIKYLYFGLILILCSKASAMDVRQLTPVERVTVSSEHFDKPMTFNVTLPASYGSEPDKRYFVMFDLHPRSQPYLSGMQDWLSHNGDWPWLETIIITQQIIIRNLRSYLFQQLKIQRINPFSTFLISRF